VINLLKYLEHTVQQVPDKPAFIGTDSALTFSELFLQARAIGSFLNSQGIYKKPIAVFMEKGAPMVAAFLGVLYGGNYYVPLDAEMPAFRIQLILETINPPLVICDSSTNDSLATWKTVDFSYINNHIIDDVALMDISNRAIDSDPAYVVFTSGSTGTPKGVIASHRSVIDYVEHLSNVLNITSDTIFGNQSPLYLDACLKELYPTLKFGASTYFIPKQLFMFPVKLIEYLNEHQVNTICWVASAFSLVAGLGTLNSITPQYLHTIAFGSEVFPIKQFNRWRAALPQARFIHLYGPTEATGMSAYYEVDRVFQDDESIPIGRPFPNTEILLLDDNGIVPEVGELGEICIRGAGLSLGYYGDVERTRAAFVQNPLSSFPDTIYKTGDIGYLNLQRELVFTSRRDHQIKHMGHRIELAEIEWAVSRYEGIQMACVVFDEVKSRIILYYSAADGVQKSDIMTYIKATLPRYMTPYAIIQLEGLPLTPGGKIDRVGLLEKYIVTTSTKNPNPVAK